MERRTRFDGGGDGVTPCLLCDAEGDTLMHLEAPPVVGGVHTIRD